MAVLMRCVLAIVLLASTLAWAQSDSRAPENEIKAAFLYKFGAFVEWPAETLAGPDGSFVIGVMGADAVAAELERITAGRTIQERAVTVRRVRRGEPLGRLQILFIGDTESARLPPDQTPPRPTRPAGTAGHRERELHHPRQHDQFRRDRE
jgi:hypothetical protein